MLRLVFSLIFTLLTTIISLSFIFQNIQAHPVFTEPFTLNYTADLKSFNNERTKIDYDSKTNILTIKKDSKDSPLNKKIKINEFQEHDLRDKIGEFRILDLNFTHHFCSDLTLCELSTLKIDTPTRSSKLIWTIDSEDSLRKLNSVEKALRGLANLN